MNKDEYKISLSNCDFNKKKIRLSSPYSLMACDLIGVDEEDLVFLSREEFLLKNPECQNLSKELQDERYNHFNKKRLNLIKEAKAKRAELIKLNKNLLSKNHEIDNINLTNNLINFGAQTLYNKIDNLKKSSSAAHMGNTMGSGFGSSTAIKMGKEKLRKMQERQELIIRLQIDYECTMEENRRNNIKKMKLKEEKEERKKREKNLRLMEKLRKEEMKERRRKMKEEEYNHQMEIKRLNNEKKERMKLEEEEKRKEEEEEKERKKQYEEQQLKEKKFREKIEKINQIQHYKLVERQKELDEKDVKRKKNIEKMKDETHRKITEKRQLMQNKIKKALIKNEFLLNEKITFYLERQKKLEEIKEQKDKEKENELIRQTIENQKKTQKIKSILLKNEEIQKQKIENYNHKMEIMKERQEKRHIQEVKSMEEELR